MKRYSAQFTIQGTLEVDAENKKDALNEMSAFLCLMDNDGVNVIEYDKEFQTIKEIESEFKC